MFLNVTIDDRSKYGSYFLSTNYWNLLKTQNLIRLHNDEIILGLNGILSPVTSLARFMDLCILLSFASCFMSLGDAETDV